MTSEPGEAQQGRGQKVVLLGSYAPSLINFRGPLIAAMVARGHEVHAVAPDIDADLAAEVRALGAEPVDVPLARTSMDPLGARVTRRALTGLFRRIRPDVVIAYTIKPTVIGAAAARAAGVPRFIPLVTGLGYAFLGGLHPKRLLVRAAAIWMYRRAFRRSWFAIFQNEDDRRDFRRLGILARSLPTGLVAGSGVDTDHYAERPLPQGISFLMISRFLRDKGVREYGEAAMRLKREHPEVNVRLAGWLDESPDAVSQAEIDAMRAGGVECLGKLDDVRPALQACSVYVLPSYREGTPRSVLEAMATGRAIVTTDAPGCRETVVEGENGFLVPPKDSDALFEAMRRFVERPELAAEMGKASRRIAEDKFDVHRVNEALMRYAGL
ncbi:MAG TPA: glycosyltransferase family 4 protein [Allosphingosinicella sp.]